MSAGSRKLRVFLAHSPRDKPVVRELYDLLALEEWVDPWLDEEKLLADQDWESEIEKALFAADAVVLCLSDHSASHEKLIQRELRVAVDLALNKPHGVIYLLPVRLDDCPLPRRLRGLQYVDYFPPNRRLQSYVRLLRSLQMCFEKVTSPETTSMLSTISIRTENGISTPLYFRGDPLPFRRSLIFSTEQDDQVTVEVYLLLGENRLAKDNVSLGKYVYEGIPPQRRGVPQIKIEIEIDNDFTLRISAVEKRTGHLQHLGALDLSSVMPPEIVDPMPPKSEQHTPDSDFADDTWDDFIDLFDEDAFKR